MSYISPPLSWHSMDRLERDHVTRHLQTPRFSSTTSSVFKSSFVPPADERRCARHLHLRANHVKEEAIHNEFPVLRQ
jgi:hypothetical protein